MRGVQNRLWVSLSKIGQHHGTADVCGMKSRMDGIFRYHHTAYRDVAFGTCRASVRHNGTADQGWGFHQDLHCVDDLFHVVGFAVVFRFDVDDELLWLGMEWDWVWCAELFQIVQHFGFA